MKNSWTECGCAAWDKMKKWDTTRKHETHLERTIAIKDYWDKTSKHEKEHDISTHNEKELQVDKTGNSETKWERAEQNEKERDKRRKNGTAQEIMGKNEKWRDKTKHSIAERQSGTKPYTSRKSRTQRERTRQHKKGWNSREQHCTKKRPGRSETNLDKTRKSEIKQERWRCSEEEWDKTINVEIWWLQLLFKIAKLD